MVAGWQGSAAISRRLGTGALEVPSRRPWAGKSTALNCMFRRFASADQEIELPRLHDAQELPGTAIAMSPRLAGMLPPVRRTQMVDQVVKS